MAENRISNYVVLAVHADTHTSMVKEDIARSLSYYQQINKRFIFVHRQIHSFDCYIRTYLHASTLIW